MTSDRYGEPELDDEELDEHGEPLSRLTPVAREHLAEMRAALARQAKP